MLYFNTCYKELAAKDLRTKQKKEESIGDSGNDPDLIA